MCVSLTFRPSALRSGWRPAARLLAGWLLVGLAAGCGRPPEPTPPRLVLLYAPCTLNRDYLAPYDPAVGFTPHLARFAEQGLVFTRHQTEAGQSGTAFASLFSGRQADGHGVFRHPTPLGAEVPLLYEVFARAGYEVYAWLEHPMASAELGYARGVPAEQHFDRMLSAEDPAFLALLDHLRARPTARALVVTNFTVTHGPYDAAPVAAFCGSHSTRCAAYEDREAFRFYADFYRRSHAFLSYDLPQVRSRSGMGEADLARLAAVIELLYEANVARLDGLFGALLGRLAASGLLADSVIAFTADHGEVLYRDNALFRWTHGHQLAPEVLAVPLILYGPRFGVAPGHSDGISRSIDVAPTLAGLAGTAFGGAAGVDLAPVVRGEQPPPRLTAFSHTGLLPQPVAEASFRWAPFHRLFPRVDAALMWVSLRREDRVYKLQRPDGEALVPAVYDLGRDPEERDDLYDPDDPAQARALATLERYRQHLIAAWQAGDRRQLDDDRQRELLRSLGYI